MIDERKANAWAENPAAAVQRIKACRAKKDAAAAALANAEAEYQAWIDSAPSELREMVDALVQLIDAEENASAAVRAKLDGIASRL